MSSSLPKTLEQLKALMARLRDPDIGCPWDQVQTFDSIAPHTLSETYEVLEAIALKDKPALKEELGDLLFQVLFYSQMAEEEGSFTLEEVLETLLAKLLRRHPHVFPDGTLKSARPPGPVTAPSWSEIKAKEQGLKPQKEDQFLLSGIPNVSPLQYAYALQAKAAEVGFDWPDAPSTLDKLREETDELAEEVLRVPASNQAIEEELGDLFFSLINTARKLNVEAEWCLAKANDKFRKRFTALEILNQEKSDNTLNDLSLGELEALWQAAKSQEVND